MNKNTIKKIILTIVILSVLVLSLVFFYRITSENHSEDISITKKIISEKYEEITYFDNSYLCAYNNQEYTIFDYNGNKLYSFVNENKVDIVSASKKYFIVKDSNYHLYNNRYEEITFGNNIYGISDYIIFVDNNIINTKGEILFYNVKNIKSYYKNKYFLVDNYFINEKGKIILADYQIIKEKVINNEIDYFIVKKNNEYYSFFPIVNNIIGDGFDNYFEYKDNVYIVANNKIYMIYTNGLRKEISFNINKNIYNVNYSNAVRKNRILAIRDYYLGILETDTNKFHKITKTKDFSFKYIDDSHINIYCNNQNYVYDLDNYKVNYTNHFDSIIIFDNNYKTIKSNGKYYLLDGEDRKITSSDKQIILLTSKVKIGKVNKEIVLFDNALYDGERIFINNKIYYKYSAKNNKYIIDNELKEKYESNTYLDHMNDTIVKKDKNTLYFYNKKTGKSYSYYLKDFTIKNKEINKNEIVISNNKDIIVLNRKGKVIKKIRNAKFVNMFYNETKQSIIIIVEQSKFGKKYKGAYVFK